MLLLDPEVVMVSLLTPEVVTVSLLAPKVAIEAILAQIAEVNLGTYCHVGREVDDPATPGL